MLHCTAAHRRHKFEERGDWSEWQEAWKVVDKDGDGYMTASVATLKLLFREHYNLLHERLGHGSEEHRESRSWTHKAHGETYGVRSGRCAPVLSCAKLPPHGSHTRPFPHATIFNEFLAPPGQLERVAGPRRAERPIANLANCPKICSGETAPNTQRGKRTLFFARTQREATEFHDWRERTFEPTEHHPGTDYQSPAHAC